MWAAAIWPHGFNSNYPAEDENFQTTEESPSAVSAGLAECKANASTRKAHARVAWKGKSQLKKGTCRVSALERWPPYFRGSQSQAHGSLFFSLGELIVQRLLGLLSTVLAVLRGNGWAKTFFINWEQELGSIWCPPSALTFDVLSLFNYIYLSVYLCIMWTHKCSGIHRTSENSLQFRCPLPCDFRDGI